MRDAEQDVRFGKSRLQCLFHVLLVAHIKDVRTTVAFVEEAVGGQDLLPQVEGCFEAGCSIGSRHDATQGQNADATVGDEQVDVATVRLLEFAIAVDKHHFSTVLEVGVYAEHEGCAECHHGVTLVHLPR